MKIAYLDCASGISGDMTLGTLVDVGVPLEQLNELVGSLGLPGCRLVAEEVKKQGFRATQVRVEYQHEHAHRHLHHIQTMIDSSRLNARQKELATRIFRRLAEAEAKVHGTDVEKVHFHEVGAADSIADIVGTAAGWELLGSPRLVASPVPVGCGKIRIAHGEVSVPAPATAELLRGVPLAPSHVEKELTTPTGAAILTTLAESFGPLPAMRLERIGCGAGQRDLEEQPNLLRLLLGESDEPAGSEQIWIAETNLDDTSGEMIGYCTSRLWEAGVLDVYTTAIQMKKNRPAVILSVLCREEQLTQVSAILFAETTTLGVRQWPVRRQVLPRQTHSVQTAWGPVEGKLAWLSGNEPRYAPEYESCRRIAEQQKVPLRAVYEAAQQAFDPRRTSDVGILAMPLLAEMNVITWGCMAVLLVVSGLLLLRTQRYFARQVRSGLPLAPPEPRRAAPTERSGPLPGSAGNWEVEMHELARELSARLDSKMGALEHLIRDADRAAARLEAALRAGAGETAPPQKTPPSSQAESLLPGRAGADAAEPGRYDELYLLADYGHPASEIAQRLGLPIGEVELILSLRKQR